MNAQAAEWTAERVRTLLAENRRARVRALLALYERQTTTEQASHVTTEHNGRGFSGVDAEILTSFAEQAMAGRTLSEKQDALLSKKLPKYARQLVEIANGR